MPSTYGILILYSRFKLIARRITGRSNNRPFFCSVNEAPSDLISGQMVIWVGWLTNLKITGNWGTYYNASQITGRSDNRPFFCLVNEAPSDLISGHV
jgi:hypothetical protein